MKRCEKMSKEDLVDMLLTNRDCEKCPVEAEHKCGNEGSCEAELHRWLNEEITLVKKPRIATISTAEETEKARKEWESMCNKNSCVSCKYNNSNGNAGWNCFVNYFCEEIEVEENGKSTD